MSKHLSLIKSFAKGDIEKKDKKTKSQKAVVYTRVSSKEQLDNLSLETQLKGCNEFAKQVVMSLPSVTIMKSADTLEALMKAP